jgi:hypothetical protein
MGHTEKVAKTEGDYFRAVVGYTTVRVGEAVVGYRGGGSGAGLVGGGAAE